MRLKVEIMLSPPGDRLVLGFSWMRLKVEIMLSPPGAGKKRCLAALFTTRLGFAS